jgi:hypothetical protein
MPYKCIFSLLKLILGYFCGSKAVFCLRMSTFCFFHNKNIRFLTFNFLNSKIPFVLLGFRYFLVVFERISFYFHLDHSDKTN